MDNMENTPKIEKTKKCKHSACNCLVENEDDYCGPYCREAGKAALICSCDHDGCKH